MKIIISAPELESEFMRLIKKYKSYYWATAWAGVSSTLFKELLSNEKRISKLIVGLHFYQTHPNFIETFIDNKNVQFIKQSEGTFHPKIISLL